MTPSKILQLQTLLKQLENSLDMDNMQLLHTVQTLQKQLEDIYN